MAQLQSIREQRHDQIYPTLDLLEIERARRFGTLRSFAAGESLWTVGQVASGLMVILAGRVAVTERRQSQAARRSRPGKLSGGTGAIVGPPGACGCRSQ